jgi:hypothetical protein
MTTAITPEIVGLGTTILEDSPMTDAEEKELVIVKTVIQTAYADKLERDLAIGAGLLKIFRRKLYRGKNGGRTWEQWLAEESAELTGGRGSLSPDKSERLRGFYRFRVELLSSPAARRDGIPLPVSPYQMRPLIGQLDTHPEAALEMWKAACAQAGKGKVPTFDQVNRAAQAFKANEANEARRLSSAQQAAQQKAVSASVASRPAAVQTPQPVQQAPAFTTPTPDFSPRPQPQPTSAPSIPAWEMEKDDASLDAGAECKRITQAINDAHKAIGLLRGILYSQLNKYGSEYLTVLRQVDAGVYSLHNIDNQVQQMGEDIDFISELLVKDVGEGELARSTVDAESFPTRA